MQTTRRTGWWTFAILSLTAGAIEAGEDQRVPAEAKNAAVRRAVAYLDDNLFQLPDSQGTPRKQFTVAVTGLVHLMKEPRTGHRDPLPRIRKYLVRFVDEVERRSQDADQLPRAHGVATSWHLIQYTWPLSVAGLFFGELHARGQDGEGTLRRIVALLEEAQQANGGWGHGRINPTGKPDPRLPKQIASIRSTYPDTLVASTNCVASTVGLAAGLLGRAEVESAGRARDYYRAAVLGNGSFPYDPSQRSSGFAKTNVGRTAGAIFAMHCLGMSRGRSFDRSAEYLLVNLPWIPEGHGSPCLNMMHGALACRALGGKILKRFRRQFEGAILAAQQKSGAFRCICEKRAFGVTCDSEQRLGGIFGEVQDVYTTALHTFVLLVERDSLEILKKPLPRAAVTRRR